MTTTYKFGVLTDDGQDVPYQHADTWALEKTAGPDRLVIAPRSDQTNLLYRFSERLEEPFLLLYVLVVSRTADEPGRYQSDLSFNFTQLRQFLTSYTEFFEKDARHNLWIRPESGNGLLVYDRHNVIYAYGPLAEFISELKLTGLAETEKIGLPFPHTHHYNGEFDSMQTRILTDEQWTVSPLPARRRESRLASCSDFSL